MRGWKHIIKIYVEAFTLIGLLNTSSGVIEYDIIHPILWKDECKHDNETKCHLPGTTKEIALREHCYTCPGTAYCVTDYVTKLSYFICASDEEMMCDPGYYGRYSLVDNKIRSEKLSCSDGTFIAIRRDCRGAICKPNDYIDPSEFKLERQQQFNGEPALVSCAEGLCPDPNIEQPFKYRAAICTKCKIQSDESGDMDTKIPLLKSTSPPVTLPEQETTSKSTTTPKIYEAKPDSTEDPNLNRNPQHTTEKTNFPNSEWKNGHTPTAKITIGIAIGVILLIFCVVRLFLWLCLFYLKSDNTNRRHNSDEGLMDAVSNEDSSNSEEMSKDSRGQPVIQHHNNYNIAEGAKVTLIENLNAKKVYNGTGSQASCTSSGRAYAASQTSSHDDDIQVDGVQASHGSCDSTVEKDLEQTLWKKLFRNGDVPEEDVQANGDRNNSRGDMDSHHTTPKTPFQDGDVVTGGVQASRDNDYVRRDMEHTAAKTLVQNGEVHSSDRDAVIVNMDQEQMTPLLDRFGDTDPNSLSGDTKSSSLSSQIRTSLQSRS